MIDKKTTTVRAYVKRVSERHKQPRTVKPKDDNRTTQAINVVIPVEIHKAMTEHRQRLQMTQSEFVEFALYQLINMPLTAQQWWEYAPWQLIETAPDYKILAIENGLPIICSRYNDVFIALDGRVVNPAKWLELPGGDV